MTSFEATEESRVDKEAEYDEHCGVRAAVIVAGIAFTLLAMKFSAERWASDTATPLVFPMLVCALLGIAITALVLLLVRR